ncbi:MAG TPA: glycosyl hydrolase family 17 protein [Candidatus Paceibacterota bacterium]|nr:hypothetical protein [Verrucomicrobiota bacterium]HOX02616.1 glycosyl hydrolase family 17 protein [Verrucomicrobiota bacterium]HRZ43683.1 glycosyl hydrolase family 17 protein [Candidatus Paceibacterota bacterium]
MNAAVFHRSSPWFCLVALFLIADPVPLQASESSAGFRPRPLAGLAYGPYRAGQSPGSVYPTTNQIREDLLMLRRYTARIRTYGAENSLAAIPALCSEAGLECYAGAWLDTSVSGNQNQIASLIQIARQNHPTTRALIVGNEVQLRGDLSQGALIAFIKTVKAQTTLPVTTAEGWHIWERSEQKPLIDAVDFIVAHVHPYWESPYYSPQLSASNAAAHVIGRLRHLRNLYPGKRIVLGETGWPTAGQTLGAAVPGLEQQRRFLADFRRMAEADGFEYFFFEACDEGWKGAEGDVGPHWGLFDSDRRLKPPFRHLLAEDIAIERISPASGGGFDLWLGTYPDLPYLLESASPGFALDWQPMRSFTGSPETNRTRIAISPAADAHLLFRNRTAD